MSNFIDNERSCRVDFFKPTGKWYATESVMFRNEDWKGAGGIGPHQGLRNAIADSDCVYGGMTAICLEPYHEWSHPISLILEDK